MLRMHRARAVRFARLKSLLLLAVFLSAGTSLPSLDTIVHHTGSEELSRSQSHVETAGSCVSHAGHCQLGRTAAGSGAVGTLIPTIRAQQPDRRMSVAVHPPSTPATHRHLTVRPRAPPAPLA